MFSIKIECCGTGLLAAAKRKWRVCGRVKSVKSEQKKKEGFHILITVVEGSGFSSVSQDIRESEDTKSGGGWDLFYYHSQFVHSALHYYINLEHYFQEVIDNLRALVIEC